MDGLLLQVSEFLVALIGFRLGLDLGRGLHVLVIVVVIVVLLVVMVVAAGKDNLFLGRFKGELDGGIYGSIVSSLG